MAEIAHLLAQEDGRLLTLTGAGGVGKTRLALQTAQGLRGNFSDGVCVVSLESLTSVTSISPAVAAAGGLELREGEEPLDQLIADLQGKQMLLVLDNFEHLLDGAYIPVSLLRRCPELRILITSRERLNLEEEQLLPLDGLTFPEGSDSSERIFAYDAVQLFVHRAQRVQPSFSPTADELPYVVEICRLVDGFPLGIELAAAWVRVTSVAEIANELRKSYDFLFSTSRNTPDRHRSVRAAFEHSWNLLAPSEQEGVRKLSVFRGGFRKEAATFVTEASYVVLAGLVDKSLLRTSQDGRYNFHALLHQYLEEKLAEHPKEQEEAKDKHGRYYYAFLMSKEGEADQKADLAAVAGEIENVRSALLWCVRMRPRHVQRVLETVNMFFGLRARYREAVELFAEAATLLDEEDPVQRPVLGDVLIRHADSRYELDADFEACRRQVEHGLRLTTFPHDCIPVLLGRHVLATLWYEAGDYVAAKQARQELEQLIEKVIDKAYLPPHLAYRASAVNLACCGSIEQQLGNYERAKEYFEEAISLNRSIGHDAHVAAIASDLGQLLHLMGQPHKALSVLKESLELTIALNLRDFVRETLNRLEPVYKTLDEHIRARDVSQAAEQIGTHEGELSEAELALLGSLLMVLLEEVAPGHGVD